MTGLRLGAGRDGEVEGREGTRRPESPHDVADPEMIRRRQSLSRNRSQLSGYPWERQQEVAGRHQEWRDAIHGMFYTLIGVCIGSWDQVKEEVSAVSAKTRRRQASRASRVCSTHFHDFVSDSRADHVAAGYCSWSKKQKRKRTPTSFVDGQTDSLIERRTVGSLGSERDRDGEQARGAGGRVEGVVLDKKSLVLRGFCLL